MYSANNFVGLIYFLSVVFLAHNFLGLKCVILLSTQEVLIRTVPTERKRSLYYTGYQYNVGD